MSWSKWTVVLLAACSEYAIQGKDDVPEGAVDTDATDCATFEAPSGWTSVPDDTCVAEPEVGTFNPVVEWHWTTNLVHPGYDDVMAAPSIGNLTDDDDDGDIDEDDIPDVVFMTFANGQYSSSGALVAISGDGSGTLWSLRAPGGEHVMGSAQVAIGDLEGDGSPEVCTAGQTSAVVCVNADGSFKWAAGTQIDAYGAPAIADMDGDGLAEVVFGRQVFDHAGNLLGVGIRGIGGGHAMSFPVDLDDDGQLEVFAGNSAHEMDGTELWYAGGFDGYGAVADFDGDGLPEIVRVRYAVELLSNTGQVLWTVALPDSGQGGPPTIADFDGDGHPEIGVASQANYTVFETAGSIRWSRPVSDYSSSQTGSAVFDFEGDGAAEVVYADEHTLWVFDGATGDVRMREDTHSSGTLMEYPLIADVDNDGSTEIIVPCNDYGIAGCNGIVVVGDLDQSWAPARPVWNQHAYHITNVNSDGTVPPVQTKNWLTWNTFRAGGTELGPGHWRPNLAPAEVDACESLCGADGVELWVVFENTGLAAAPAHNAALMTASGATVRTLAVAEIGAGQTAVVGPVVLDQLMWDGELFVAEDSDRVIDECDETDNLMSIGTWPCDEAR